MPTGVGSSTLDEACRRRGVTPFQLARWRGEDLMPHVLFRRGRGRGTGGSECFYDIAVIDHLDTLLTVRRRWRTDRPALLRPLLWLSGRAVPWERVRTDFQILAAPARQKLAVLVHGSVPTESGREARVDALTARFVKEDADIEPAIKGARARRRSGTLSRSVGIRAREWPVIAHILASLAVAGELPFSLDTPLGGTLDAPEDATPGETLQRAFGTRPEVVHEADAMNLLEPQEALKVLPTISEQEARCVLIFLYWFWRHMPESRRLIRPGRHARWSLVIVASQVGHLVAVMRRAMLSPNPDALDALPQQVGITGRAFAVGRTFWKNEP